MTWNEHSVCEREIEELKEDTMVSFSQVDYNFLPMFLEWYDHNCLNIHNSTAYISGVLNTLSLLGLKIEDILKLKENQL